MVSNTKTAACNNIIKVMKLSKAGYSIIFLIEVSILCKMLLENISNFGSVMVGAECDQY